MSYGPSYDARYCLLPATKELVRQNVGLAYTVCRNSKAGHTLDPDDRIQVALEGLIAAAVNFDPSLGYKFSTYACNCMARMLIQAAETNHLIRIPTHVQHRGYEHRPDLVSMAARAASVSRFEDMRDATDRPFEPPDREDSTEDAVERERLRDAMRAAIRDLPPRTRTIMAERARGKTLESIGRQMGISRERVRQIERDAIEVLRCRLVPGYQPGRKGEGRAESLARMAV